MPGRATSETWVYNASVMSSRVSPPGPSDSPAEDPVLSRYDPDADAWPVPRTADQVPATGWSTEDREVALRGVGRRLEYQLDIDPDTGAYNKHGFAKRLAERREGNLKAHHALVYIDLGNFKRVNEFEPDGSGGDERGNDVLKRVVQLFGRENDLVGRLAGDQFVVYIDATPRERDVEDIKILQEQIARVEAVREPIVAAYPALDEGPIRFFIAAAGVLLEPGVSFEAALHVANRAEATKKDQLHRQYGAYRTRPAD